MEVVLSDNIVLNLAFGDLLLYGHTNNHIEIKEVKNEPISLYNCVEILSFSLKRHFVSDGPFI